MSKKRRSKTDSSSQVVLGLTMALSLSCVSWRLPILISHLMMIPELDGRKEGWLDGWMDGEFASGSCESWMPASGFQVF